jgi:hypothetical protein
MAPAAYQGRRAMEARMNGDDIYRQQQLGIQRDRLGLEGQRLAYAAQSDADRNKAMLDRAKIENNIPLNSPEPAPPPPISSAPSISPDVNAELRKYGAEGNFEDISSTLKRSGITDENQIRQIATEITGDKNIGLGFLQQPVDLPSVFGYAPPKMSRGDLLNRGAFATMAGPLGLAANYLYDRFGGNRRPRRASAGASGSWE